MKKSRPLDSALPPGPQFVLPGEVVALREAGRRLGLAKQALCDAQRAGLKTVTIGRVKLTTGTWVRVFCEQLAAEQAPSGQGSSAAA